MTSRRRRKEKRKLFRQKQKALAARMGARRPPAPRDNEWWRSEYQCSLREGVRSYEEKPPTGGADATADRSLMSRLHEESEATRAEVLRKAQRVSPLFNKGGLQYATDGDDKKV